MQTRFLTAIVVTFFSICGDLRAATFDVMTLADSGPGSLRQAILDANTTSGDDTITFSVAGTITLTTNLPWITDNVAIVGPGTNDLTIDGAGSYYAFYMSGGHTNWVSDVTVANTRAIGS